MVVLFGLLFLGYVLFDSHQRSAPIKVEIERFIESELKNCRIINNKEAKFSGMGYYTKVKTDCTDQWYPILFEVEQMRTLDEKIFKTNSVLISKEKGLKEVLVFDGTNEFILDIRAQSSLDDDYDFFFGLGIVVLLAIFLIFFEEKMRDKDGKSIFLK